MSNTIPDTDKREVAQHAAALRLVEATEPNSFDPLKSKLKRLIDSYEIIDALNDIDTARAKFKEMFPG